MAFFFCGFRVAVRLLLAVRANKTKDCAKYKYKYVCACACVYVEFSVCSKKKHLFAVFVCVAFYRRYFIYFHFSSPST